MSKDRANARIPWHEVQGECVIYRGEIHRWRRDGSSLNLTAHRYQFGYHWSAEAARRANTGVRFWVYVTTVPLTLLTLVNLVVAWRAQGPSRKWWLSAALTALADRAITFSYFVPTMVTLMSDESMTPSEAVAMAARWGQLNYVRHAIVLVAWLLALKAFSLLCRRNEVPPT